MIKSNKKSKSFVASLLLVLAAFIWGSTFLAQKEGLSQIGNFTFLALRSYLAVAVLTPVSFFIYKNNKKKYGDGDHGENKSFFSKRLFIGGVLCGASVCIASLMQQYGMVFSEQNSTVSRAGFLTTLYILMPFSRSSPYRF